MAPFLVYKCRDANAENGAWVPREVGLGWCRDKRLPAACPVWRNMAAVFAGCVPVERGGLLTNDYFFDL